MHIDTNDKNSHTFFCVRAFSTNEMFFFFCYTQNTSSYNFYIEFSVSFFLGARSLLFFSIFFRRFSIETKWKCADEDEYGIYIYILW